ncbi:hypothetical protein SPRG_10159 [Saprolegnia parasitica CBS 223.65]|uniref:Major facilitator superfamily (MFS) profile domain-containing protein n=1 Tax=Saprolegnia parasitica (strain CBS 223.65) TaxID=695850 RepID=A0A067CCU9_SAPPC|nr:hypothetical protein SPRG_10159 [Saprolegnia parasitica CBS 223.65]KDO24627.1 hypothetical protein SPRG_10159 [Saprolegnia parasitica CBS 223.65]|eukprot:XP_012204695.1 hypothetical protein SPRG_10159 [Saprolegnia parasitica CBS 223.65]
MARSVVLAQVLFVLLSDILFSGVIYGWAPLALMLQEEDQYGELCLGVRDGVRCSDQDTQLNLVYAVATFLSSMISLPVGMLMDRIGPKYTILVAGVLQTTGLFFLGAADSKTLDVFVPAYATLAVGGGMTLMGSFSSSFLVPEYQTVILAAVSCAFDGSSAVMLGLYYLHESLGWSRHAIFTGYAVLCLAVYACLVGLWHVNEHLLVEVPPNEGETKRLLPPVPTAAASIWDHLKSFEFVYLLIFTSIHLFRANLYIGTTTNVLEIYGDDMDGHIFTKLFGFILPLGFLFVPVINHVVEDRGMPMAMYVTVGLGLLYNALALVPLLPLQVVTFGVFTAFRAFLYTVITAFAAKIFGLTFMGTLVGFIYSSGSLVSLLQIPAVAYANARHDYSHVYIGTLVLGAVLVPLTEQYRQRALLAASSGAVGEP